MKKLNESQKNFYSTSPSTSATNTKNIYSHHQIKNRDRESRQISKTFEEKNIKKRGKRRELFSIQNAIQLN